MKKNRIIIVSVIISCVFLLFSCASKSEEEPVALEATEETESTAMHTEPVQQAGTWQENSLSNIAQCGYFYTSGELSALGEKGSVEAEFKKDSGYEHAGFGFAFGYKPSVNGYITDYIRFEITTSGHYALYSYIGGVYTDLVEEQGKDEAYLYTSSAVKNGNGMVNLLKVVKKSNGKFDCFVNGTKIKTDIAAAVEGASGCCAFFSVGSKDQEKFPDEPVKVSFLVK